ncbi:ABC-F family ATP-binding cassette domain-containing protein [Rhodocytophaga aerolata]|uniref:ABC-F family ATP-binding cassette domain-containing protein n=1 Tax=Rhodocytophaga aerolata TaxID=455078 RepID=A0ABT8R5S3_9BACT|nr:ABC-F family ATP-binding cassette domain-containing protein [Rhodocytophaga aerolata]MDO1447451.1 ABC-F family ATP-binding cassette domain-containing protein [Rhodocytophaga aerolata]
MLSINNLSFYFGSRPLYQNVNLHIKPKDRIGLIGANGTGKSTLLRLIVGEYQPDEGTISKSGECTIGFLNQDLLSYQTNDSILSVAMQAFERENMLQKEIDRILHEMENNYSDELVNKLTRLQEEFDMLGGYTIQSKSEEILEGLGFTTQDLERPLREFSGGWRMRVMLAKLLLQNPSLLMLDEPTNHLDLPSIQWIENYLNNYEGAVIIVSHDRQFLENAVNMIVEVSGQKLNVYAGNYSFYIEEKAMRNEIQKGAYENQQAKIRQTERFIERFRSKATKARQVQSRIKALDRMDVIDDVIDETAKVNFRFNFKQQTGRFIMHLEHVSKAYGEKVILKDSHAVIERGDKIALIGANGKGKSTLLRIIAGTEPIRGERRLGYNVNFSFYAQHQLEALNVENTLLDELKQAGSEKTEMELRSVLGCFLFTNDEVFKKIKVLSGGEKSRVALARTLISEANFLLLDEPTNHLDIQSVNILIQALQQYEGSYVVVSHDRHFVSHVANKIWYIEDYQIKEYPGTFEEYEIWQAERLKNSKSETATKQPVTKEKPKETKTAYSDDQKKEFQKQLKKVSAQVQEIEDRINKLEAQKVALENDLARAEVYADAQKLEQTNLQYKQITEVLDNAQQQWEDALLEQEEWEKKLS